MSEADFLFNPGIIPDLCHASIGEELLLRPLAANDHIRGHLQLLSVLTAAPALSPSEYSDVFCRLKACPDTYYTIVIVHKSTDMLVACGSIILERKFVRGGGVMGHIEDIAVVESMQGRKLGIKIINTLEAIGRAMGCYKIILDCSKDKIPFYEKCGFKHKEYQMVRYFSDSSRPQGPTAMMSKL